MASAAYATPLNLPLHDETAAKIAAVPEEAAMLAADPEQRDDQILESAKSIIGKLESLANQQVTAKRDIEERWLEDLRHYYGKYEQREEADLDTADRSKAFVKLTRHKTNGWAARLSDLLMPTEGKNWGIEPTPIPKLAAAAKEAVKQAQQLVDQANSTAAAADAAPTPEQQAVMRRQAQSTADQASAYADKAQHNEATVAEAKKRAKAMEEAIDDQLTESDYQAQCREVIENGCRLGTGILKGPLTSNRTRQEWRATKVAANEVWELAQIPDPMPEFVSVDPWHFFPDMSAKRIGATEFTFERSLPTGKDLRKFAKTLGFNKNAVRRLLREGAGESPDAGLTWLADLRQITDEGSPIKGRYVMWEYHGPLDHEDVCTLLRAGGEIDAAREYELENDPLDEPRVIIHFCRGEVLKIAPEYPLDSGDTLYSVWNFEKGETSIFGIGIPNIMYDSQHALNSAWRMMMDNSGLSVGPQIVLDKGAIEPQDGSYDLKPLKVWLRTTTALANPNNPAFQAVNIPNNQNQLSGIIELARSFADEETSMPMIAQGEQGAASHTLGGMSMLFNSANVIFRRSVKAFDDDLTKPTLRRAYHWNMQFNPDPKIKGDMAIKALGTSVLLVREIQSQNLLNVMTQWTVHPVIGGFVKVREGLVKTLETMMIAPDEVLYTQEEADKRLADAAQKQAEAAQAAQPQPGAEQPPPDPMQTPVVIAAQIRAQAMKDEAQAKREIEQAHLDMEMAKLQETSGLKREEIQARHGASIGKIQSDERRHAADIAVEQQRQAAGINPGEGIG